MLERSHLGSTVFYIGPRDEIVPGVVTAILDGGKSANLALVRDGVNHAHIDPHVYGIEYAPPHPVEGPKRGTYILRGQF